ncbi:antibiotic biosynthesis monooxygenase [Algoriphagus sp. CAU 1675]|uniref:antibiotic biosynthesis monooxygenase family protein n=1 Tax=Algoriphagus sp. CAU 1675 TaxID=3032597 RepID=UPI0023DC4B97|nr:antibiotic biosynthesis monooxygenase [Algoriphagus sp. CAU 1675]MDF2158415.1 antibiotic biosynthesis monooxygenase [Algoriphagus sp. CAU 1675]
MFIAVYSFKVKPGEEDTFIEAWKALTELIYKHKGSRGSRLHLSSKNTYIGYAKWPDRETWQSLKTLPIEAEVLRKKLGESCEEITTVYEMEVVEDLLKDKVFDS